MTRLYVEVILIHGHRGSHGRMLMASIWTSLAYLAADMSLSSFDEYEEAPQLQKCSKTF
jgi:hypothetical protein